MGKTIQERLSDKFIKAKGPLDTPCWKWTGCKTVEGYGRLQPDIKAHRASYEIFVGDIPNELCVCHKCDDRSCINPEHLFLGTRTDNAADCVAKGRHNFGAKNPNAKLTDTKARQIINMLHEGLSLTNIAKRFDITKYAVSDIKRGKTWNHLRVGG